jgi:hypothetical protein
MATIKLGELLVKAKVLQETQLKAALAEQQKWGGKLGEILVRMNFLTEDLLVKALSKQLALPVVNLDAIQGVPPHVKTKVTAVMCRDLSLVPLQLRDEGKTLVVAISDPLNLDLTDTLRAATGCKIVTQLAGRSQIQRAFSRFYEGEADLGDSEGSFKLIDAGGRTVVKVKGQNPSSASPAPAFEPVREGRISNSSPNIPAVPRPTLQDVPSETKPAPPITNGSAVELLREIEEVQRKEVAALKALVELMIEKGVFTRNEYLEKVKR